MSRVVKRSASQAVKAGRSRRDAPLPQFVPPHLSQPVHQPLRGRNGCMKSDWTAIAWRHGSTAAACNCSPGPAWTRAPISKRPRRAGEPERQDRLHRRRAMRRRRRWTAELCTDAGGDRRGARRAPHLLRFRSLAHWRMGRLGLVAGWAQSAARAIGFEQARPLTMAATTQATANSS
jgi:hypothetical protein